MWDIAETARALQMHHVHVAKHQDQLLPLPQTQPHHQNQEVPVILYR